MKLTLKSTLLLPASNGTVSAGLDFHEKFIFIFFAAYLSSQVLTYTKLHIEIAQKVICTSYTTIKKSSYLI